ncbi:peptide deformylase [Clostridium sp. JN-9]|uniref:peptide deformylase n=1 Tax=Clostridium sp. JN-9 TaxID=2507159 RepID=UPI000FFE26FA|nr:peptide deformylase [Clostridium sp. JN-9]QAT40279.1 peptide deformylase [Clostridium sp. JN-9]
MAVRDILIVPDKMLKRVSRRVDKFDDSTLKLAEDLKDTLYSTTGIGVAAPQIGVLKRVIYIDLRDDTEPVLLINPKIIAKYGKEDSIEGCLSYPGFEGVVERPKKVRVNGFNEEGKKVQYSADGLLCKAFCHEIDHLNGIIFLDKAKKIYREDS